MGESTRNLFACLHPWANEVHPASSDGPTRRWIELSSRRRGEPSGEESEGWWWPVVAITALVEPDR
jgi:hypothetical protein